jgi:cytochrome c oxidase cbb3-type subunit 2
VVISLPDRYRPKTGVVVARPEALDLVAYLQGLDHSYPAPPLAVRDDGYSEPGEPR